MSFACLAGSASRHGKRTWAGAEERRSLLARVGVTLHHVGPAGARAGVNDVLDAAAVAWTAHRVARGEADSLPDPPETFADGIPAAIRV